MNAWCSGGNVKAITHVCVRFFFFFERVSIYGVHSDDSFLSLNQDTNRYLVEAEIEPQISYSTIRDFSS